jgi:hypothetical protein
MKLIAALTIVSSFMFAPAMSIGNEKVPHVKLQTIAKQTHIFKQMDYLPAKSRKVFSCIMWIESRSTPKKLNATDYNSYSGAGGVFQFIPYIWQWAAKQLGIKTQYAQQASLKDQFRVAAFYYKRNSGFNPEWSGDLYAC